MDLIANTAGVTVERTRGTEQLAKSSNGFNAVPGDVLTFSVPVVNRGMLASPKLMRVTGPDESDPQAMFLHWEFGRTACRIRLKYPLVNR